MKEELNSRNQSLFLNYNKKRHRELLEYSKSLKQQGTSLKDESIKKEKELSNYSCVLDAQLDWEFRDVYFELFRRLMNKEITSGQFFAEFFKLDRLNLEVHDFLESKAVLLSPNEKSLDFSDLISEIFEYCESFEDNLGFLDESSDSFAMEYWSSMKAFYLELQQFDSNLEV